MKLTPDDLARLDAKQLANIIRKIGAGKTPTAREAAILAQAKVGGASDAASAFAKTWGELAERLGVSLRALKDWRADPRYKPTLPRDRDDGRHDVAAWAAFMVQHGLKRADEHIESIDEDDADAPGVIKPPLVAGTQAQWNVAIAAVDHAKKQTGLAVLQGALLVAAELEVPLGATFAAIQTKLSQFPARVARYLTGLRDPGEIEDKLRDEIDADLADLHAARFTGESAVAEAVAAVPFDAESERLLSLVTFASQDRDALMQLITAIATEALRRLGRTAVEQVSGAKIPVELHESTGQVTDETTEREARRRASSDPAKSDMPPEKAKPKAPGKRRRKARPKTARAPAEVEAAIATAPRRKAKRRRPR